MKLLTPLRPRVRAAVTMLSLALVVGLTACKDSTSPDDDNEPNVTSMVLTFSNGQSATVTGVGATPSVRIPVGATAVTARFLTAAGSDDPVVTASVFRLEVSAPAGNVTFNRSPTNGFSGTLTTTVATTTAVPVTFALLHIAEGHSDFGPLTVNISVGN